MGDEPETGVPEGSGVGSCGVGLCPEIGVETGVGVVMPIGCGFAGDAGVDVGVVAALVIVTVVEVSIFK
jgi:hypothetical protein